MNPEPFDPFERALEIEKIVIDGRRQKHYRFRYSRHYGGIVSADAVGCNILCAYCWNHSRNQSLERVGAYYLSGGGGRPLLGQRSRIGPGKKVDGASGGGW